MARPRLIAGKVIRDDVTLAVRDNRREDAPSVVLLTGLGTSQRAWDRVLSRLTGRYRIITFDYRGHGRSSPAAEYPFDTFLSDLDAVLINTAPRDPLLCGWSFGADLAIWYAAQHPRAPIASVIALDGAIPADPDLGQDQLRQQLSTPWARTMGHLMRMLGVGVHLTTDEVLGLLRDADERRTTIIEAYRQLHIPVMVALGSRPTRAPGSDRMMQLWRAGAQKLAAAQPHITLTWIDSDHAIPLRRPDEVAHLITMMQT